MSTVFRAANIFCLLEMVACSAPRVYSGKVIDTHGRAVAYAHVSAGFSPPDMAQHEVTTETNASGEFSLDLDTFSLVTTGQRPRYIEASSRDGKRYGLLSPVLPKENLLVIR